MPITDRAAIKTDWNSRGFSCDLWQDPPGQRWEDYVHEVDEVVIVLEGEMEFEVEGEIHHPQIGIELFIPAHAVHSVRNIGAVTSRWLYGYRIRR
ncbi:MAG: cupin domain-containing protein [Magnetococcales bacterium]|nr:cupin domain-containing protein [Magnetococcales bacterium]